MEEMPRWYQALDLLVAPQRWEGFGLTPLEAMACGVPVIATTVGAFDELVVEGKTGRLISPGDTGTDARGGRCGDCLTLHAATMVDRGPAPR